MIDQEALAAFADFMRPAMLRLFVYPGGFFALAVALICLLAARLAQRWISPPTGTARRPSIEWLATTAFALGWCGWSLVPLPGTVPLPWQPDVLVVLSLIVAGGMAEIVAYTKPITAPVAMGRGLLLGAALLWLLATGDDPALLVAQALIGSAYLAGLVAAFGGYDFRRETAASWLGWFTWAALPVALLSGSATGLLWPSGTQLEGQIAVSAIGLLLIVATPLIGTRVARRAGELTWPWAWLLLAMALLLVLIAV